MRPKRQRQTEANSFRNSRFARVIHEAIFIVTIAAAIFLLLSLITYHATDPGWSRTGLSNSIANAGGYVGAWLADVFLCAFGYMAYVFPFMTV